MAALNDIELREVFHFLFLERLLRISDAKLFVLKGGVNLRFFMKSPRYSEDMDLDVLGGATATLKKNGYKILDDASFKRVLAGHGIVDLKINDPAKAKHTETTQRFRVRLVNRAGEEFPTKVEFSRRDPVESSVQDYAMEAIDPSITSKYHRISYRCQHYSGKAAVAQKILALSQRPVTQARDVFDLYILYLAGHFDSKSWSFGTETLTKARENAIAISYRQYTDQVVHYLSQEAQASYGTREEWNAMQTQILDELS